MSNSKKSHPFYVARRAYIYEPGKRSLPEYLVIHTSQEYCIGCFTRSGYEIVSVKLGMRHAKRLAGKLNDVRKIMDS